MALEELQQVVEVVRAEGAIGSDDVDLEADQLRIGLLRR